MAARAAQSAVGGPDPCLTRVRAPAYFLLLVAGYEQTHKARGVLADAAWYAQALGRIVVEPAVKVRAIEPRMVLARSPAHQFSTSRGHLTGWLSNFPTGFEDHRPMAA